MNEEKIYRPNVAAIIMSSGYPYSHNVFIGHRSDIKDAWQFPQGGIDGDESPEQALFRELKEEIGTNSIEVLSRYPEWLSYDFPSGKKMGIYSGQKQIYFLVKLKKNAKITIPTKDLEFDSYKFVKIEEVLDHINHFKKPIYQIALTYFKKEGFI
ncbi:RNA pyrophosphohydrolase [uncultured Campylobacter sp.]|uniref:RNA pyrophosphohydrolase n=1 Tax=uncultured Campylobacter sp. TaxID=218934 RepID=UPI00262011C8|nr:RNA pyrophosphohydrolase [uncultured Campylobacter sp.]